MNAEEALAEATAFVAEHGIGKSHAEHVRLTAMAILRGEWLGLTAGAKIADAAFARMQRESEQ